MVHPHALTVKIMVHSTKVVLKTGILRNKKKNMPRDNVPFIVARKIFEGNKADNKWNIPTKNQKNFPNVSQKDAAKEPSQRHLHSAKGFRHTTQSLQNSRAILLTGQEVTSTSKRLGQERVGKERNLDQLINLLMRIPDAEVLINRIWRTVEFHLQYNDGTEPQ
jgi:hypothetical protein